MFFALRKSLRWPRRVCWSARLVLAISVLAASAAPVSAGPRGVDDRSGHARRNGQRRDRDQRPGSGDRGSWHAERRLSRVPVDRVRRHAGPLAWRSGKLNGPSPAG